MSRVSERLRKKRKIEKLESEASSSSIINKVREKSESPEVLEVGTDFGGDPTADSALENVASTSAGTSTDVMVMSKLRPRRNAPAITAPQNKKNNPKKKRVAKNQLAGQRTRQIKKSITYYIMTNMLHNKWSPLDELVDRLKQFTDPKGSYYPFRNAAIPKELCAAVTEFHFNPIFTNALIAATKLSKQIASHIKKGGDRFRRSNRIINPEDIVENKSKRSNKKQSLDKVTSPLTILNINLTPEDMKLIFKESDKDITVDSGASNGDSSTTNKTKESSEKNDEPTDTPSKSDDNMDENVLKDENPSEKRSSGNSPTEPPKEESRDSEITKKYTTPIRHTITLNANIPDLKHVARAPMRVIFNVTSNNDVLSLATVCDDEPFPPFNRRQKKKGARRPRSACSSVERNIGLQGDKREPNEEAESKATIPKSPDDFNTLGLCLICTKSLTFGKVAVTNCGHLFCYDCIDLTLKTQPDCPNCEKLIGYSYLDKPFVEVFFG